MYYKRERVREGGGGEDEGREGGSEGEEGGRGRERK